MALLLLVILVGAGGFATYRLNLVPALTERVDALLGTARDVAAGAIGGMTGGAGAVTAAGAFVAEDGTPVGPDSFGFPPAPSGDPTSTWTAAAPFIAPEVDRATLDADLKSIESAFASGDPGQVTSWVHPDTRSNLMPAFEANASRLGEVAALLATRKPVFVTNEYAEYEVTDKGTTFTVVYQKSGDHWTLSGL